MIIVYLRGYITSRVYRFQTSSKFVNSKDHFPYCKIIYHGATGEAALGAIVAIISIMCFVVLNLCDH